MAILAVSLVAILNMHSGGVRMHNHAKFLTVATMLARSKMVDVEEKLYKDGLPDFDETEEGTFEDEGFPKFKWKAEIVKPDLQVDSADIVGLITQGLGLDPSALGGSASGSSGSGGPTTVGGMGGIEGMIGPMVEQFVPRLEESVREVRLTVSWQDITGPSEFSVATHVIKLPEQQGVPGGQADVQAHQLDSQNRRANNAAQEQINRLNRAGVNTGAPNRPGWLPGGAPSGLRPPVLNRPNVFKGNKR